MSLPPAVIIMVLPITVFSGPESCQVSLKLQSENEGVTLKSTNHSSPEVEDLTEHQIRPNSRDMLDVPFRCLARLGVRILSIA